MTASVRGQGEMVDMAISLEIQSGAAAGKSIDLSPGRSATVGRLDQADVVLQDDPMLSNLHFVLECGAEGCVLKDLGSRFGTFVNGAKAERVVLHDGDQIVAGKTRFVLRLVAEQAPPQAVSPPVAGAVAPEPAVGSEALGRKHAGALEILRQQPEPLFALLDAARTPRVLQLLAEMNGSSESLYEGFQGQVLARFAPYLVPLEKTSTLLERLVQEGWGNSWGVYLTCAESFKEVRRHFRHFLLVKTEGGEELYFRFYDPRVLRVFLPTCSPEETRTFFGPVTSFLHEGKESRQLLRFTPTPSGVRQESLTLLEPAPTAAAR